MPFDPDAVYHLTITLFGGEIIRWKKLVGLDMAKQCAVEKAAGFWHPDDEAVYVGPGQIANVRIDPENLELEAKMEAEQSKR